MREAFLQVAAFEKAAGHELSTRPPDVPCDFTTLPLRAKLITEEHKETIDALAKLQEWMSYGEQGPAYSEDLAELADGLCDLIFVAIGTAIRFGIDLPKCWDEVCRSNLSKFGPGSWKDETGKVRKPESWVPPDIIGVITSQKPLEDTYHAEG